MDTSPSSLTKEELQEAFDALYEESIKMAERNMEFKNSLKIVILEKEVIEQRVTSVENEVASLQEELKINTSLKEELAREKEENIKPLKEKVDST